MIDIVGKNIKITNAMKEIATNKVLTGIKLIDRATSVKLTVEVLHRTHIVKLLIVLKGKTFKFVSKTDNFYTSLDEVIFTANNSLSKFNSKFKRKGKVSPLKINYLDDNLIDISSSNYNL